MREVILFGLDDGLIADVMEKGVCEDYLIYKWKTDGKTLKEFLKEHKVDERVGAEIVDGNRYEITAYDW